MARLNTEAAAEGADGIGRESSMHDIDPSPIRDDDSAVAELEANLGPAGPKSHIPLHSRPAVLGLSTHSTSWYLSRIQRYSSYTFSIFAAFHITNTALIPLLTRSVPASEPYLLLTRPYYQSPLLEPLLIGIPLVAHIGSGFALRLFRRRQETEMYGAESYSQRRTMSWPPVSGISKLGYLLIPLVAGHAFINRGIPLKEHGGSSSIGLSYVSHGFARFPVLSTLGYSALLGVGVWHVVWGWAKYLSLTPGYVSTSGEMGKAQRRRRWWAVNAVAAVVAGMWMTGGMGVVGRAGATTGWVGREYDELYRSIPILGHWL